MRRLIVGALRKDGFDVTEVADGMRLLIHVIAREAEPERAYDLIISDLRMPVTSGLQILRGLRNSGWTVPFILCTAFGDEPIRNDAERLGAIYFDKPFDLDELRTVVRDIFRPSENS
jgi:DNA-binding response OmpR family regulator